MTKTLKQYLSCKKSYKEKRAMIIWKKAYQKHLLAKAQKHKNWNILANNSNNLKTLTNKIMKTTNYEISKQLAGAGFKGKHDFSWYKNESGKKLLNYGRCGTVTFQDSEERILDYYEYCFPAYDLETILEALPESVNLPESVKFKDKWFWFEMDKNSIIYEEPDNGICLFHIHINQYESFADAAAKMWLKLKQEELV